MNKKFLLFLVVVLLFCILTGLFYRLKSNGPEKIIAVDITNSNQPAQNKKLQIVATFYPLEHFAKQVGGPDVDVHTLTPSGGEPHDYEPTPQDIIRIQNADVFLMNGAGFEPWAEKIIPQLKQKGVKVVQMSEYVDLLSTDEPDEHTEEPKINETDEHDHGNVDPHIWLDPNNVRVQVLAIRDAFFAVDSKNAEAFRSRSAQYIQKLTDLSEEYESGLQNCKQNEIITSHNAFRYLSKRYGFEVHSIAGLSPTQEPSAQHLGELVKLVREKKIQYIFTEILASTKFTETLAREAKVKTLVLNPAEGLTQDQVEAGETFESILNQNLQSLRLGLECK